ncbi:hypothetical protein VCR15J5_480071 [Vibrio crassostreae]|nr:hypothetical protein VCR15J5_480071 [Vibrio crassostreae]
MFVLCGRANFKSLYFIRAVDGGKLNDDCYDSLFDECVLYLV